MQNATHIRPLKANATANQPICCVDDVICWSAVADAAVVHTENYMLNWSKSKIQELYCVNPKCCAQSPFILASCAPMLKSINFVNWFGNWVNFRDVIWFKAKLLSMLYNSKIQNQITNNYRYFDFHRNKGRNEKKENRHDEEEKENRKCVRLHGKCVMRNRNGFWLKMNV